jgi:hypothetical protein
MSLTDFPLLGRFLNIPDTGGTRTIFCSNKIGYLVPTVFAVTK